MVSAEDQRGRVDVQEERAGCGGKRAEEISFEREVDVWVLGEGEVDLGADWGGQKGGECVGWTKEAPRGGHRGEGRRLEVGVAVGWGWPLEAEWGRGVRRVPDVRTTWITIRDRSTNQAMTDDRDGASQCRQRKGRVNWFRNRLSVDMCLCAAGETRRADE